MRPLLSIGTYEQANAAFYILVFLYAHLAGVFD